MSQREYGRGRSRGSSFDFKAPYNRAFHGESEHRNPSYSHDSLDLRQKLQDSRAQRNEYNWERSHAGSEGYRQYSDNNRSYEHDEYYQNRRASNPRRSDVDMGMTKSYDRYAGPVRTDRSEASRTSYSSRSSDGGEHKHHSSRSSYHIGPTKDIVHNSRSETRQDDMKKKHLSRKSNQSSGSSVRDTVSGRKPSIRASSSTDVEPKPQEDDILYILADDNRFDEESEKLFGPGAVSSTSILDINTCSKEIKCLVNDYKTNLDEPLQVHAEPTGSFVDVSSANRGSSTNNNRSISNDRHSTINKDYDRSGSSDDHRRKSSRSESSSRFRTKQECHISSRDKLQDKTKDKYHAPRSNRTSQPDTNFRKCESIPKRPGMEDGAIVNVGRSTYDKTSYFQINSRDTDLQYNNNIGIHEHNDNRPRESDRMPASPFYEDSSFSNQFNGPPLSQKNQPYRKKYVSKKIADKYFTKPRTIDQAMKGNGNEFGFRKGKEFGYRKPITDTFRAQGTSKKCLYITDGKKHERYNNGNSLGEVYKKGRYQLKSHNNSSVLHTRKDNTAKSVGLRQYDRVRKKYFRGGFTNRSRIRNNNSRFVQNKNESENKYENVSDTKSDQENDAHIQNVVEDSFPQISHPFVAPDQNQPIIFLPKPEFQTANAQSIDQFGNVIVNPEILAQNVVNQTMSLQLDNSAVPPPPPGTEYVFIPFVNPGGALLDTVPADQGIPPITPTGTIFCTNEQAASNVVSSGPVLKNKSEKLRKLALSHQQKHQRRQQLLIKKKKFEKKVADGIIKKVIEKRKLKGTRNLETASKNPRAHADTNAVALRGQRQPYSKSKDRKYDDISDLEDVSDDENKYEKVSDLEDVSDDDDTNADKQKFGHVGKKNFIRKSVGPGSTIKREHDSTDFKLSNPEKRILKIKRTIKQEVADLRKVVESPNSSSPVKRRRINVTLHEKTRHVPVHSTTDASTFSRQANEPSESRNLVYEKRPMSPLHITVKNDHYTEDEESRIKEQDSNSTERKYTHKNDHDESVNIYREKDYRNDKVSQRYTRGHEPRRDKWYYHDRKEVSSSYDRVKIEKEQRRELNKDHQSFITVKNEHYAEHEESRIKEHDSNSRERQYAHRHDHDDGVNIYTEQDDNNDKLSQRYTRGREQRRGEWSCHDSKEVSRSYDKDKIEKGQHRELHKDHQNFVTVKNDHYAEHEESRIKEHDTSSNNRDRKYSHRHDHDEDVNTYREQDYNNDKPSQRYTRDHQQRTGNWSCHDSKEISRSYDRDKDEKEQHGELNKDHKNVDIRKQTRASFNEIGTSKMKATVNYDDETYSGDEYQGNTRRHTSLESKDNKGRSWRSDREPLNNRSTQLEHDEHCKGNVSQMTSYTNDRDQYDTDRDKSVPQYDDKIDTDRNKYRHHVERKDDSMNKTIDLQFQNDNERGKLSHQPRKSVISHDMDKEKPVSPSTIVYSDPTHFSNTTLQEHSNRMPAYNLNPKKDGQFDSFQIQKSSNDRQTSHFNAVSVPAALNAVSQNHSEKSQNVFDPSLPPSLSERTSLTPDRKNAPDMSLPPPPMPSDNLLGQPRFVIQQQSVTNQLLSNAADQPQRNVNDLLSSQQFPNSPMLQLQQQVLAQQGLQSQLQNQQQLIMASINQQHLGQQQVFVNPQQQQSNVFGQSQLPGQNTGMQQLIVQQANKQQTFQQTQQPRLIQQTPLPNTQQIQNQQNFQQMQNQQNFQQLQNQQNIQQMQMQHFQQIQTGQSNNVTKQPPATQQKLTVNQQHQPANQQQLQLAMLRAKYATQQQRVDLQSKVVGTVTATKSGGNVGSGVSGIVHQRMLNSSQISQVKPALLPLPSGIRPNNNYVQGVTGGALLQLPAGRVQYASNSSSAGQSGIPVSRSNTISQAPVMYDSKPSTNAGKMMDEESIEDPDNMTCNRCDLHFVSVPLFKRHVRWHNFYNRNIKDLRCDDCQQAFPTTSMLRDHNTERHSGNAYSCGSCDAIFTALYALFRHTKSTGHHTRVKAHYLCSECKSSFSTHDALVDHRKSRHPEKKVYNVRPYN